MKNTLKKLMPYALTGVISGATVFGASHYISSEKNGEDFSYFTTASDKASFAGIGS
ncbi:MAG: protease, partial [Chryseobacterium sp.]